MGPTSNEWTITSDDGEAARQGPLTTRQAAAVLGLGEETVRRAIRRGRLAASKRGRVFQIAPSDLAWYREAHPDRDRDRHLPAPPRPFLLPRPISSLAGRLPTPLTPLVGREREQGEVAALLLPPRSHRLLTLVGAGGIGKTRLAIGVAAEVAAGFADGAAFVPLAAIADPALVAAAIAKAAGVPEVGRRPLVDQLAAGLADKHLLLVVDTFEHLADAAPLLGALLGACPRLIALVTSRARLRLDGEVTFPVPPLATPRELDHDLSHEAVAGVAAVRLFTERARAVDPAFAVTAENAAAVAGICRRLEGLPLAIELAAARVTILPPPRLLARLERRLPILRDGPRDAPDRLRSLRAAIAWSYDLLTGPEQCLLRQLAVCRGGCTLSSVEALAGCGSPGASDSGPATDPPSLTTLDLVSSLVDKSLLRWTGAADADPRFEMLEVVQEYGLERAAALGEDGTPRQRHAAHFLAFAETAEPALRGPEQLAHLDRLDADHDNLRAALGWGLATPERADSALRLAGVLHWFWYLRGHVDEGRRWLEAALAAPAGGRTPARAKALIGAGLLAYRQDDHAVGRARLLEGIAIGRELGDATSLAHALHFLAVGYLLHADHATFGSIVAESADLFRESGDRWSLATALAARGIVAIVTGRPAEADGPFAESLSLFRELDDRWGIARVLHYAGEVARSRGDQARARVLYEESLARYRDLGHHIPAATVLHNLGYVAQHQGEPRRGLGCFADALAEHAEYGNRANIGHCLGGVAGMAGLLGWSTPAAHLFGAAAELLDAIGTPIWPVDKDDYERNLAAVRSRLGEAAFAAAFAAGRALPLPHAIAEALALREEIDRAAAKREAATTAAATWELTPRELEILRLLARRATDREIADRLSISPRTVMHHVSHILAKLGVANRRAAAALAAERGLA